MNKNELIEEIEGLRKTLTGLESQYEVDRNNGREDCLDEVIELIKQQPDPIDQLVENIRAIRVELAKVKNGNYLFSSTDYERIDKMLYDLQYKTDTAK